jgi:hypothetical protein
MSTDLSLRTGCPSGFESHVYRYLFNNLADNKFINLPLQITPCGLMTKTKTFQGFN